MKKRYIIKVFGAAAFAVIFGFFASLASADAKPKSAAELEKEKAMQNPYPNDLGPEKVDVSSYPKAMQAGYKLMAAKCSRCHTSARPLNSRFVEPDVAKDKKIQAVAELKKSSPELFKDISVWQIEEDVWNRYVKRMMNKPGCELERADAKKIWEFLVYDSAKRKLGANAKAWETHRKKLIADFKQKYPKRYEELSKDKDL